MTRDEYRSNLAGATVGIAGAGGLGSTCALALARAGVGCLVIVDFDLVSKDNLDRQAYSLDQVGMPKVEALAATIGRVDPSIRVIPLVQRLDRSSAAIVFAHCDAVVEALDDPAAKQMLLEAIQGAWPERPLVGASGIAGYGRPERLRVIRSGSLRLVGDFESEVGPDMPPMAPRVMAAAAMEADLVLEALLDAQRPKNPDSAIKP
jgi:sulfur carrier protein ThiS adenylyltransferase